MKKFLGLPIITVTPNLGATFKNYLGTILFGGLWYFMTAMMVGSIQGDVWKYIESVDKYYTYQGIFIILGIVLGHMTKVLLNQFNSFWIKPSWDKYIYPIFFIIAFLVINEIGGL